MSLRASPCSTAGPAVARATRSTNHANPDSTIPAPNSTGTKTLVCCGRLSQANGFAGAGVFSCSRRSDPLVDRSMADEPVEAAIHSGDPGEADGAEEGNLGGDEDRC